MTWCVERGAESESHSYGPVFRSTLYSTLFMIWEQRMTITIAVAGKGGTGKTTLSGLLVRYLVQHQGGKILAIDADPSSNLHLVLGLPLTQTIGDIREDSRTGVTPGQTRQDWLGYAVRMAVEEGDDCDLLAMGRPEGQGCYCAANHMLRSIMDGINAGYDYVVMDNEAGMEHLSRRTTRDLDHLLLVSDASLRGMTAAEAMLTLSKESGDQRPQHLPGGEPRRRRDDAGDPGQGRGDGRPAARRGAL